MIWILAAESINQLLSLPLVPWLLQWATDGHDWLLLTLAKDAGWMSAGWAQYRAMESLTSICKREQCQADSVSRSGWYYRAGEVALLMLRYCLNRRVFCGWPVSGDRARRNDSLQVWFPSGGYTELAALHQLPRLRQRCCHHRCLSRTGVM